MKSHSWESSGGKDRKQDKVSRCLGDKCNVNLKQKDQIPPGLWGISEVCSVPCTQHEHVWPSDLWTDIQPHPFRCCSPFVFVHFQKWLTRIHQHSSSSSWICPVSMRLADSRCCAELLTESLCRLDVFEPLDGPEIWWKKIRMKF